MEYRDVYTKDGVLKKRAVPKHAPSSAGDYFRHVLVIMKTADSPAPGTGEGLYIMQQRSLKARFYAGLWDVTGGSVQSGEDLRSAAVREVREELGLVLNKESLVPAWDYIANWGRESGLLISVFGCRVQVPENGICFDPHEVNDVKTVPYHVFRENVLDHNDDAFARELDRLEQTL